MSHFITINGNALCVYYYGIVLFVNVSIGICIEKNFDNKSYIAFLFKVDVKPSKKMMS